eukprot:6272219-Prymnesium_polylepis.1
MALRAAARKPANNPSTPMGYMAMASHATPLMTSCSSLLASPVVHSTATSLTSQARVVRFASKSPVSNS